MIQTNDRRLTVESGDFVGVPWKPRGITTDAPGGIRKRFITRALVQAHGATDGRPACQGNGQVHVQGNGQVHVPRCVGNDVKTSLTKRNSQVNHVRWYSKTGQVMRLNKSCQNHNNNMHQSQSPMHSHPVRATKSQCKSARRRAVQETPMTRVK